MAHPVLLEPSVGRGHSHAGKAWSRSPEVKQDDVTIWPGTSHRRPMVRRRSLH